jgi:hypothetical protein
VQRSRNAEEKEKKGTREIIKLQNFEIRAK